MKVEFSAASLGVDFCLINNPRQSPKKADYWVDQPQRLKGILRSMQTPGLNHIILTVSNTERSHAFYGDLLGFPVTVIEEDPDKSFFFTSGGVQFFFFPSRQPIPNDRFSEFRIGLDHLSFSAPNKEALQELAHKLTAAGVDTKGAEQFIHTGNWYVSFRDPDSIQLEYWLP